MGKTFILSEEELRGVIKGIIDQSPPGRYDLNSPNDVDELNLPVPEEDKEVIKTAVASGKRRSMGYIDIDVRQDRWSLGKKSFKDKNFGVSLSHDYNFDKWSGCGPSEDECRIFNYRELGGKKEAEKFARNFATYRGPLKRFFFGEEEF